MNGRGDILRAIGDQLEEIARAEATNLWRIARDAETRGCSGALVNALREEGWEVWNARNDPHRLVDFRFFYRFKYAFRIGGGRYDC